MLAQGLGAQLTAWVTSSRQSIRVSHGGDGSSPEISLGIGASLCPALSLPGAGCLGLRQAAESLGIESHYINNTIGSRL